MRRSGGAPLLLTLAAVLLLLLGALELPVSLLRVGTAGLGAAVLLLAGLWKRSQERREAARLRDPGRTGRRPGAGELPPV